MEQHYAVSKKGVLSHIKDAHYNLEDHYCPNCGCRMIKRCGDIRKWHFAHDWRWADDAQKSCSYETYLHGYAKLRLKRWFDESESIILHYQQTILCKNHDSCVLAQDNCSSVLTKSCDLKTLFDLCSIESSVKESNGIYRADLLLTSESNPYRHILFEIKVTHGCSEKKKASNAYIIEFDVSSEEDVEYIVSHDIKTSEKVRYYGFKNLIKKDEEDIVKPTQYYRKFFLYRSGKTFCKLVDCQSITKRCPSSIFELTAYISRGYNYDFNLYGLMKAAEIGLQYPNCYICEHYCYNKKYGSYECEIKNAMVEKVSEALSCSLYVFKHDVFDEVRYIGLPIKIIDTWSTVPLGQEK